MRSPDDGGDLPAPEVRAGLYGFIEESGTFGPTVSGGFCLVSLEFIGLKLPLQTKGKRMLAAWNCPTRAITLPLQTRP